MPIGDIPVFQEPVRIASPTVVGDEADAARMRSLLEAEAIPYFVNQAYSPYELGVGELGEVHWFVDRRDAERAFRALQPPEPAVAEWDAGEAESSDWRVRRAFRLGRWFLYLQAAGGGLALMVVAPSPLLPLALGNFLLPLWLARWSRRDPRAAFAAAVGFGVAALLLGVLLRGLAGMIVVIPLLAVYFAWRAASPGRPGGTHQQGERSTDS